MHPIFCNTVHAHEKTLCMHKQKNCSTRARAYALNTHAQLFNARAVLSTRESTGEILNISPCTGTLKKHSARTGRVTR